MDVGATMGISNCALTTPQIGNFFTSEAGGPPSQAQVGTDTKLMITGGNDACESSLTIMSPAVSDYASSHATAAGAGAGAGAAAGSGAGVGVGIVAGAGVGDGASSSGDAPQPKVAVGLSPVPMATIPDHFYL
jgi:hypothetical protein